MSFTRKDELGTTEPSIAGLRKKFRTNNANAEERNEDGNDHRNVDDGDDDDARNDDDGTLDLLAAWLGIDGSRYNRREVLILAQLEADRVCPVRTEVVSSLVLRSRRRAMATLTKTAASPSAATLIDFLRPQ